MNIDTTNVGNGKSISILNRNKDLQFYNNDDKEIGQSIQLVNKNDDIIKINHLQMMNAGKNVLLLGSEENNRILRMNSEYSKITENFGAILDGIRYKYQRKNWDLSINTIIPTQKFGGLKSSSDDVLELTGLGGKTNDTVFTLLYDTRSRNDYIVKKDTSNRYKNSRFTSIATTVNGDVITGDNTGVLRVYDDISKSATRKFDQLEGVSSFNNNKGDPIIGIDTTKNKEWVCWTTKGFIAIMRMNKNGWEKKSEKPRAMLLKAKNINNINFLPAKFDAGPLVNLNSESITESFLYTFSDNYRITWSMRIIAKEYEKGTTTCYGNVKSLNKSVYAFIPEYGRPGTDESVISLGDKIKHLKIN